MSFSSEFSSPKNFLKNISSTPTLLANNPAPQHELDFKLPKRINKVRATDHTDEHISERSPSRSGVIQSNMMNKQIIQRNNGTNFIKSFESKSITPRMQFLQPAQIKVITKNEQTVIQLKERLKNINHFYRVRIEEERQKNLQRNQIFIGVIEDLQRIHNERVASLQGELIETEGDKKDMEYVDERMQRIQTTIQEILIQSKELKQENSALQEEVIRKQLQIKQKQEKQRKIKEELSALRGVLQSFQKLKLKQTQKNKQLIQIIDSEKPS